MMEIAVWFVVANAGLMGLYLLDRERQIASAWRAFRASLDLDRTRPLIERCYDLLIEHYGADTFADPQLAATPQAQGSGVDRYLSLAEIAAGRWQVTLPSVSFRPVPQNPHGFVGTYSRDPHCGYRWDGVEGVPPRVEWSEIHQIGLAPHLLTDHEALPIVIAHEVSHLVLHRDQVTTGSQSDDEILTDVATALIGYGELMRVMRSRTRRLQLPGRRLGWSISGPGYLHPEEISYALALHTERMTAVPVSDPAKA